MFTKAIVPLNNIIISRGFISFSGIVYPYLTAEPVDAPDGAMVIRCVAVFVGIYQASTVSSTCSRSCEICEG